MGSSTYLIALGSNRAGRHGGPAAEIRAAIAAIGGVVSVSPLFATPPLGPSSRRYVNAACLVVSEETPPALLARLKAIERAFGRRSGRRWGTRVIDLDIILWSGGRWTSRGLSVPHAAFRERDFVLRPAVALARDWRDPVSGLTLVHLSARLTRARRTLRGAHPFGGR